MMSTDLENLREKLENEAMRKSDAMKALSRLAAEKSKGRLGSDLDDISMEYERVHAAALITEKRAKNFDKVLGEWQSKASDVGAEVEASQNEGRNYSSELFRLKAAQDEAVEQLDIVKRENKNLADEIKDLLDQLGDGGRSIHDLDKQRRRLETEKEELQAALEEAEATLEMEENKVLRAQLELGQVRQDIDRRVAEKEDEFNNTRKNHARAMDSLGASIETEQRAKGEALRVKKQLEGEINELEIGLDHANKANAEGLKSISAIKPSFVRPSNSLRMKLVQKHKSVSKLASLNAKQLLSLERQQKAKPFWMDLAVLSVSCRLTSLMLVVLSTICRLSTDAI